MSLHCYVVPQSLAARSARIVRRVATGRHVGHGSAQRPHIPLIHRAVSSAASEPTCSAPIQALRAMRALASLPGAALVAGGVALGAAGAGLIDRASPAPSTAVAAYGGSGGGGPGGGTGYASNAGSPGTLLDAGIAATPTSGTPPATDSPAAVPYIVGSASPPVGLPDIPPAAPLARRVQHGRDVSPPADTPGPNLASPPPQPSPVPDVSGPPAVNVPEPVGMDWIGFVLVGGVMVWKRSRTASR